MGKVLIKTMDTDVADGLLLDVRNMRLEELSAQDGSALNLALDRLLSASANTNYNSFGSSI
jgi:hypothetical protein